MTDAPAKPALEIHTRPTGREREVNVGNYWFVLNRPVRNAPPAVRNALRLLFPVSRERIIPSDQRCSICLCADTTCSRKGSQTGEITGCPRNAFGICVDATIEANDGKAPSLRVFGFLSGASKQSIDKSLRVAQKALITAILNDPVLREYCEVLGLKAEGSRKALNGLEKAPRQ